MLELKDITFKVIINGQEKEILKDINSKFEDKKFIVITTGIIKIPKLKLMSGLSIRLGAQANPVVGNFSAVGVPVESRYNSYVMEIDFLNNDIDSDM